MSFEAQNMTNAPVWRKDFPFRETRWKRTVLAQNQHCTWEQGCLLMKEGNKKADVTLCHWSEILEQVNLGPVQRKLNTRESKKTCVVGCVGCVGPVVEGL
jgi:hypothetical protein